MTAQLLELSTSVRIDANTNTCVNTSAQAERIWIIHSETRCNFLLINSFLLINNLNLPVFNYSSTRKSLQNLTLPLIIRSRVENICKYKFKHTLKLGIPVEQSVFPHHRPSSLEPKPVGKSLLHGNTAEMFKQEAKKKLVVTSGAQVN